MQSQHQCTARLCRSAAVAGGHTRARVVRAGKKSVQVRHSALLTKLSTYANKDVRNRVNPGLHVSMAEPKLGFHSIGADNCLVYAAEALLKLA